MNKGTLQPFAAGIILSTAVVAGYEHWFQPEHDSIEEATSLLKQKGYTVKADIKEEKAKDTAPEAKQPSEKQQPENIEEAASKVEDVKKETQSVPKEAKTAPYKLSIRSGMTSIDIAALLEKEGIVADAKAFEQYLEQNELNKEIQVGEYELGNMTIQQVAKTITE
ncbi:hypothetical protein [Bacillus sp. CECT 9360]|uniref:hypothetical protein n=1 Tax=Bacillus sp. CECT 9360 TaxID=2845821 RepID=UPI001E564E6A|nr:hypothetical protein [Bacillus sp. CECT 9360]CAH0347003.1 Endolytic murein transglycosylase [Bacillus sp. CECT 9360]